jgi:Flp pilus assembly pilin Flp
MMRLRMAVEHLFRDENGQDLIEYGLLVVLIVVAAVVAVGALGTSINNVLWLPIVSAI